MRALPSPYSLLFCLAAVALLAAVSPLRAQVRVRPPTPIDPQSPFYNPQSPSATLVNQAAPPPQMPSATLNPTITPAPTEFDPYGDPATQAPTLTPYAAAPAGGGAFAQPYAPPTTSPYAGIGHGNFIQPQPVQSPYGQALPDGTLAPRQRLLHEIHFDSTELLRFGPHGFGSIDVGLDTVFAWPLFRIMNPVFITPGFAYHSWNGPATGNFAGNIDLPPNAYDAYLDTSWHPQLTSWFSADLDVRVGVYSDFHAINADSIRVLGRGVGIVTLSPQWQVAAGIWYLNRLTVQILPAGGVIWTPNQDTRFAILFPNPKLSRRLVTIGNTDLWGYLAGEYGGGRWSVRRANGASDLVELNDLRALAGLEWFMLSGLRGNMEIGYVFDRHIIYRSGPQAHPSDTVLFRGGVTY